MFKSKIVWITGASSGLGEALAHAFAREGSKLVLSARNEHELERVKRNCKLRENDIMIVPFDLANHSEIHIKVSRVLQRFGTIETSATMRELPSAPWLPTPGFRWIKN